MSQQQAQAAKPAEQKKSGPTPTVGRIVHFYSKSIAENNYGGDGFGGQGAGPYAAMITGTINNPDGDVIGVHLRVMPPLALEFNEARVETEDTSPDRYWEWPPRG